MALSLRVALLVALATRAHTCSSARWQRLNEAHTQAHTQLVVTVALRQPQLAVQRMLADLQRASDPGSMTYGKNRWSFNRIQGDLAPEQAAWLKVKAWIVSGGGDIEETALSNRGFIRASFHVHEAEELFTTKIHRYAHKLRGYETLCADDYSLPSHIVPHIEFVAGLTRLPTHFENDRHPLVIGTGAPEFNTNPALLRRLYSLPSEPARAAGNLQAVAAFNNESFLPSDLEQFQKLEELVVRPVATHGPAIVGGRATAEGSLDIDYVSGIGVNISTVVWATAGQTYDPGDQKYDNEPFLAWVVNVSSTPPPIPHIFSISYQDYEDTLPPAFMKRISTEFAALAMRGTTVVTCSGDWGVGCSSDFRPTPALHFRSDFPSSSPYVVSVGATTFRPGQEPAAGAEVGVAFSSGGFSNLFPSPSYQQRAVSTFIQQTPVSHLLFNSSGRGFPDVAAVGVNYEIICNGKVRHAGGTSASTPAFAGVLSLLNSARLSKGQSTLGWANPFLYHAQTQDRRGFFDVTDGNNKHEACCGFNATRGWDWIQ